MASKEQDRRAVITASQKLNPVLLSLRSSMRLHRLVLIGESIGAAAIAVWLGATASLDQSATLMRLVSTDGLIRLLIAAALIIIAPVTAFLAARRLPEQMQEAAACIGRLREGSTEGADELADGLSAASRRLKLGMAVSAGCFLAGIVLLMQS